jgi:hypothetical protein
VSINAFEQRVNDNGVKFGGPGVGVTLFHVTIVGGDDVFVATPVGQGSTGAAAVKVNGSLSKAAASAADVPLCDDFPCEAGAQTSISVSVQWSGQGPTSGYRDHITVNEPGCFVNDRLSGRSRAATATGQVDGEVWTVPSIPGFEPSLFRDAFGSTARCA